MFYILIYSNYNLQKIIEEFVGDKVNRDYEIYEFHVASAKRRYVNRGYVEVAKYIENPHKLKHNDIMEHRNDRRSLPPARRYQVISVKIHRQDMNHDIRHKVFRTNQEMIRNPAKQRVGQ